jgi:O-acetyl-ADP-ribose deacetylase (regulator of RNase III)
MIEMKNGNILLADVEALVNTVNCVGIMGRGIALQFKDAYPENFKEYQRACKNEEVQPGKMLVHELKRLTNPRFIINFPTKRHWKGKSRMEDIEAGLIDLRDTIERLGIKSIAIPPLGSGLGGLNWRDVRPRIEEMVSHLSDVQVLIFEPLTDKIEKSKTVDRNPPNMTVSRALLVLLMDKYRRAILDPYVSLLEVHKLLYLLQEAGQDLKLNFAKAPYGPFAANVRHVLLAVEGYYVVGYDGGADTPQKRLDIVPGAVDEAQAKIAAETEVLARLHRVFDLVEGWETPHGLELLATVHWVATREDGNGTEDVLAKTYAWNVRKKKFTPRQIELAYSSLKAHGWLE